MPAVSLLFGPFELQPAQRRLLRDGEPVALRARAFDLLQVLVERAGELVSKAELLDSVWPGVVVEENNIAAQVAALRKVVGGEHIATVPGRGYRFTTPVHDAAAPARARAPAPAVPAATLPPSHHLLGRDEDLLQLRQRLAAGGCVTLVGAGGVGKTVLARALAAQWTGTVWVDLAALTDGVQLPGAVCRALGLTLPEPSPDVLAALAESLARALPDNARLLVLDNAEHLLESTARLAAELLKAAPRLPLLLTSQVPLRIAGETVLPLEPLALPMDELADDDAFACAAVQLLVQRIEHADPRFVIAAAALPLLRRLCQRLDGLPLAIEMAAAIVPLLGLHGVLAALEQPLAALRRGRRDAPTRHKTLQAAMAWSHGLLQPLEQRVFRRLGVFASGFSIELATSVVGDTGGEHKDEWELMDALAALVERSLVASLHTDPPRYRLLETMRSFALDRLEAAGEAAPTRRRAVHALVAAMGPQPSQSPDARVVSELPNVPDLLAWARAHEPAAAMQLTLAASAVATWTPWLGEAAHWVAAAEPLLGDAIPLAQQAQWWRELARFQSFVRGPRTVEAARRACEIERVLGNPSGLFWSLIPLLRSRALDETEFEHCRHEVQALLAAHPDWPARNRVIFSGSLALEYRRRGDFDAAWVHQQEEAALAEHAGLQQVADNARSNLAATLVGLGRYGEALALTQSLLARNGEQASPINAHNRVQQLNALIGLHRLDEAQAFAAEALAWCRRYEVLDIYQVLALLAAGQGRAEAAAMLLGHHRHSLAQRGASLPEDSHAPWRDALRMARETLGETTLQGLMARGAALDAAAVAGLLD